VRFADSADDNDKLGGGTEKYKTKIAINSNGSCKWMAPAIFQSTCDINTEFFPFDDQVRHLFICTYLFIQVLCLFVPHNQHICVGSESKSILLFTTGDEFPRRLCDPLPPATAVLYYHWLAAGLHDKIISQGVGDFAIRDISMANICELSDTE